MRVSMPPMKKVASPKPRTPPNIISSRFMGFWINHVPNPTTMPAINQTPIAQAIRRPHLRCASLRLATLRGVVGQSLGYSYGLHRPFPDELLVASPNDQARMRIAPGSTVIDTGVVPLISPSRSSGVAVVRDDAQRADLKYSTQGMSTWEPSNTLANRWNICQRDALRRITTSILPSSTFARGANRIPDPEKTVLQATTSRKSSSKLRSSRTSVALRRLGNRICQNRSNCVPGWTKHPQPLRRAVDVGHASPADDGHAVVGLTIRFHLDHVKCTRSSRENASRALQRAGDSELFRHIVPGSRGDKSERDRLRFSPLDQTASRRREPCRPRRSHRVCHNDRTGRSGQSCGRVRRIPSPVHLSRIRPPRREAQPDPESPAHAASRRED